MANLNSSITKLDICGNQAGHREVRALCQNTTLMSLTMGESYYDRFRAELGPKGARKQPTEDEEIPKKLRAVLEKNRTAQIQRRDQFFRVIFILVRDRYRCNNRKSLWSRLPRDLQRYILIHWLGNDIQVAHSIGKIPHQVKALMEFLFANIHEANERLTRGMGVRVLEKAGASTIQLEFYCGL